jgi:transposase InsO family protein
LPCGAQDDPPTGLIVNGSNSSNANVRSWRIHGRAARTLRNGQAGRPRLGYAFVHSAIDGYSRLAYSEVLDDEQGRTAAGFWLRAVAFFAEHRIHVERVLTDNGACYRSRDFAAALGTVTHSRTQPYRPATNGKVCERFNRTLLAEWAYARAWTSEGQRTRGLTPGCIATTITDTTPPSAAHPSPASAT